MPKFLVLRFSSIGDIVLTTPVIRCLKQQVPGAVVHYFTKKAFEPVISSNPYIDKYFLLEKDLSRLLKELKKEKYDYIIDLHNNLRTARIKLSLGVKSYSFNKLNWEKWLMVNWKINKLPVKHIVDRYLDTLEAFKVINDKKGLDYFIPEKDEVNLNDLNSVLKADVFIPGMKYVAFVIGAQHFTKRLPEEKIISILNKISIPVILLGGKDDKHRADVILKNVGKNVFNACGLFNINQSASIVKQAHKVITHDTGLMHIAAAFNKDIISVWGNTIPEFGMYPYMPENEAGFTIAEVKGLYCRPCSKIGYSKCPKGHFRCMKEINEEEIVREISKG